MNREEWRNAVSDVGLGDYWLRLEPLLRPALYIKTLPTEHEPIIGATKFGGQPDLPPELSWPVSPRGNPLRFLAQFSLSETARLGSGTILPATGLLSFFYYDSFYLGEGTETDVEYEDSISAVFYFPMGRLERGVSPTVESPVALLQMEPLMRLPCGVDRMAEIFGDALRAQVFHQMMEIDYDSHQLLGHAVFPSEDEMGADLEMTARGLRQPDPPEYLSPLEICRREGCIEQVRDWQLLLTLEYDEALDWYWGKGGTLYFLIRQQDLAAARFSDVRVYNWFV